MVFLGIVFKTRLKYSKELFDYNVKIKKNYLNLLVEVSSFSSKFIIGLNIFSYPV